MRSSRSAILIAGAVLVGACSSGASAPEAGGDQTPTTSTATTTIATAAPTTSEDVEQPEVPTTADAESAGDESEATESTREGSVADDEGVVPSCAETGEFTIALPVGTDVREVRVFIPSIASPDAALSMVVNWHGLGSTGSDQAGFTGYEGLAESEGFIVVHPTGDPGEAGRNNWEFGVFDDPTKDDLAYANALLDTMIDGSCVDERRVYSTGMSNGGLFTATLVCELADRFAAAASVAGVSHPDDCSPSRPVPYIAFHGTDDAIVTFDGSTGGEALFSEVMPEEFAEFAADFGCEPEPDASDVAEDVIRYDYRGCEGDVPVTFFEIVEGGHTWPSSPLAVFVEGTLGRTTDSVDATADAWAFFQQHTLG